jgi:hypothetical protein
MARVYLETSFISACVSTRADIGSAYRRQTSLEWWTTQLPSHEVFVSAEVLGELESPTYRSRDAALEMVRDIPLIAITEEALGLATVLVSQRVMPGPVQGDAIHVAASCVHGIEFLLSWNVRHLANPSKVAHLTTICTRAGYLAPRIVTPDLLWNAGP